MEATTETNQNNRELTATEIQIAIAQIEDRLMRVAKAQSELAEIAEGVDEKEFAEKLRTKYDIPEGVHLFFEGVDAALTKRDFKTCKLYLAAFVKGALTDHGISDLLFYFDECSECDYGWILVDRPMGFYNQPSDEDIDEIEAEIKSIGTRSRAKNTKLPRIAGVFSSK